MSKRKSRLLWVLALIITLAAAIYQRTTGPTYPVKGSVTIDGKEYSYKLIRSHGGKGDAAISIKVPKEISGIVKYRHFRSSEAFTSIKMQFEENKLVARLPHQPPAGKLEYYVMLKKGNNEYKLNQQAVVIRYKGGVPLGILIPHIIFMFTAMFVSTRAGIEAIAGGSKTKVLALVTLVSLFIGGLILGPFVQKYAFGEFWTGWPFGGDWTDNKTIFGLLFWLIAYLVLRKKPQNKLWPVIAMIVLFVVYMIPHSMGGSELNTKTGKISTGLKK